MFVKTPNDITLENDIKKKKKELEVTFANNLQIQQKTLSLIFKANTHSASKNLNSNRTIWNAAGYINIISFDLKIVGRDLFFSTNEWEKRYFARQACLLMYEGMNDILELLGKSFRKEISLLSNFNELLIELNQITQKLNLFKNNNEGKLKKIRNVSIAHRDQNIFEQIDTISSIIWYEIIEIVSSFDNITNDLGSFLQKVIKKSVDELDK